MAIIKSSSSLRNNYNDISEFCNKHDEPVFITKNGEGDLAVMSMSLYEKLNARNELYEKINVGLKDIEDGNLIDYNYVVADLEEKYGKR